MEEISVQESTDLSSVSQFKDVLENLSTTIYHCTSNIHLFLNHRFLEAKNNVLLYVDKSFYHAHGYSCILAIEAFLTFDPQTFSSAIEAAKRASYMANLSRRKTTFIESLGRIIGKSNHDLYTDEEMHAEMCYAESQLIQGCLVAVMEESIFGLFKAGFKFRSAYQSYRECFHLYNYREWSDNIEDQNFVSSICFGVGFFHCVVSIMPQKFLNILEFVGFKENRKGGLNFLEKGSVLKETIHGPLCTLFLCTFHMFITQMLGYSDGDLEYSEKAVNQLGDYFPDSALFPFFAGRLHVLKGNFEDAITHFQKTIIFNKHQWQRFNHVGMWELMWVYFYTGQFRKASEMASILYKESPWSKAIFAYLKCAFLYEEREHLSSVEWEEIEKLMDTVPRLRKKFAGRSIPLENIAASKAKRFLLNGDLSLKALEMNFLLSGMNQLVKESNSIEKHLGLINRFLDELEDKKHLNKYYYDDLSLANLLKGILHFHKQDLIVAEECFRNVCDAEEKLKEDSYLVPYAMFELGMLYASTGKLDQARKLIELGYTEYSGYEMETRLHLKTQVALRQLNQVNGAVQHNNMFFSVEMPALQDDLTEIELAEDTLQNV